MRFGDKQLTALYVAACSVAALKGTPRGLENGGVKDLKKAIEKMGKEINRRAHEKQLREACTVRR